MFRSTSRRAFEREVRAVLRREFGPAVADRAAEARRAADRCDAVGVAHLLGVQPVPTNAGVVAHVLAASFGCCAAVETVASHRAAEGVR